MWKVILFNIIETFISNADSLQFNIISKSYMYPQVLSDAAFDKQDEIETLKE